MRGWEFIYGYNGYWPCTDNPDTSSITDVFEIDSAAEPAVHDYEYGRCHDEIWKDEWVYQDFIFARISRYVST